MTNDNRIEEAVRCAREALEEHKGHRVQILDIRALSPVADYFIIADGSSTPQLEAMTEAVEEKLAGMGFRPRGREGLHSPGWILLDYGDFVVHIFSEEERQFYDLEHIWGDSRMVTE